MKSPDPVSVRAVTLDDVDGIREIHADCDDPWSHPGVGPVWVNHRLLRGFYVDVATIGTKVVGHAEWNVSDEPAPGGRCLYLGMIQIHRDYQRRGVGQAMVDAGISRARSLSCRSIRTIPDVEARGFYSKCRFEPVERIASVDLQTSGAVLPSGWSRISRVPYTVVTTLPFRLGCSGQACSNFMWEICNHPIKVAGEQDRHPCARSNSGKAYVQLRYTGGRSALAIAWAINDIPLGELVAVSQGLAASLGISAVTVSVSDSESDDLSVVVGKMASLTAEVWERKVPQDS